MENAVEIKAKIQSTIEGLSTDKLKVALDFLEDLKRDEDELTRSLVSDPLFMEDYRQAKENIRTGDTVSWADIKRDV